MLPSLKEKEILTILARIKKDRMTKGKTLQEMSKDLGLSFSDYVAFERIGTGLKFLPFIQLLMKKGYVPVPKKRVNGK